MNILIIFLLVLIGFVASLLFIALFMRRQYHVRREVIIGAQLQKVFDFLRFLKNQEEFNKWAKADANRKKEFKGTDGTVGFIYSWSGNKEAGEGEKEIMNIVEGKRIEAEIRFVKPMRISAAVIMETEFLSANETKVYFTNAGPLPYPMNLMIPIFEKNFAKDMDVSLATLKAILEK